MPPNANAAERLARLPNNFKCADVICDFRGYLAQVKSTRVRNIETVPNTVLIVPGAHGYWPS
jgi:type II restriction enzyme